MFDQCFCVLTMHENDPSTTLSLVLDDLSLSSPLLSSHSLLCLSLFSLLSILSSFLSSAQSFSHSHVLFYQDLFLSLDSPLSCSNPLFSLLISLSCIIFLALFPSTNFALLFFANYLLSCSNILFQALSISPSILPLFRSSLSLSFFHSIF